MHSAFKGEREIERERANEQHIHTVNRIFSTSELFQSLKLSQLNAIFKFGFPLQNKKSNKMRLPKLVHAQPSYKCKIRNCNMDREKNTRRNKHILQSLYSFCLI